MSFPTWRASAASWWSLAAGTAVAAWLNFGSPRISYAGFQFAIIFCIAVLHFGPSHNLTVIRDRMIGVVFGLIVFGTIEYLLWPVRATDALRARVAELMHLLAELARTEAHKETVSNTDADSWRQQVSQKVEDIQRLIETSKFETGPLKVDKIQKHLGDAQIIFILLITLARQSHDVTQPDVVRAAAGRDR